VNPEQVEPPVAVADGPLWRVARHLGVYSVGTALSLASSFLLLLVYATQFSAREFGIVATGQVVALASVTVARLGLTNGMFRFLAEYNSEGNTRAADQSVTTNFSASFVTSVVVTVAMVAGWMIVGAGKSADIQLSGYLIALNVALSAPGEMAGYALRAKQQSGPYVVLMSAITIVTTALTIAFVILLHAGAVAVFASTAIANTLMSVAGVIMLRRHLRPDTFSTAELRQSLRFGVPNMPALIADWIMQFSDRLFLTRFAGLAQVGVYSLGYRIGLIEQQVLGTATNAAWDPFILAEYKAPEGLQSIGRVATYFAALGMALVLFISAAAPGLLAVIHARPEYAGATSVVFLIALANFFATMQHMLAAPINLRLRPELGLVFRGSGALVNIVLNFALIPTFGMMGAAWSTLATYVAIVAITIAVCRRLMPIPYEYGKIGLMVTAGVAVQLVVMVVQASGLFVLTALSPAWCLVLFAGLLVATGAFTVGDLRSVMRRLRRVTAS
jgi:O-antigen/teichoic acid export membrane protein